MRKPLLVLIAVVLFAALTGTAEAKWPANGTPVCIAASYQINPASCTDGAGGALIAWQDQRSGYFDIYIQRIDELGNPVWTTQGNQVCTAPNNQEDFDMISDGAGGAFLAWEDWRSGYCDVYVQHVDASGTPLWTADGVRILETTLDQERFPRLALDNSGGILVTYQHAPSITGWDILAQRVDAFGDTLWAANGVVVCEAAGHQYVPQIVSDAQGGAVIVWEDFRGGSWKVIYAQRVDSTGTTLWSNNGALVLDYTYVSGALQMDVTTDGAGGAIAVCRVEDEGDHEIMAARITSLGGHPWGNTVIISYGPSDRFDPSIAPDGNGGAVIVWQDDRNGGTANSDIYAQRINSAGARYWTNNGVVVCTAGGEQEAPELVFDAGVTTITWRDERNGNRDIYAQRLNSGGSSLLGANGVPVCSAPGEQNQPTIVASSARQAIIAFTDHRGSDFDIYVGDILPAICSVSPLALDFGVLNIGDNKDLDFVVTNVGGDSLFGSVSQEVCAGLNVVSGAGPFALEHQDSVIVTVRFEPQSNDTLTCEVYTGCDTVYCTGLAGSFPTITAAEDVPSDQGGYVYVTWDAPLLDNPPHRVITHYSVWRSLSDQMLAARLLEGIGQSPNSGSQPVSGGPVIRTTVSAGVAYYWEWVGDLQAHYLAGYMYTTPTLYDSTGADPAYHAFMVSSQTADPFVFWDSEPVTSYSVDNLSPAPPQALAGEQNYTPEGLQLTWEPNVEGDLDGYRIYRGMSSDFIPDAGNLIATTTQEGWFDDQWRWDAGSWYKVSAIDIHDNESGFAVTGPGNVIGVTTPGVPDAFALGQNVPNPFNPTTTISYDVPAGGGAVTLRVYDVSGRLVRTLVDGQQSPGTKSVVWNGTNDRGQSVASGIYFYRMTATEFSSTRKMVLLQ